MPFHTNKSKLASDLGCLPSEIEMISEFTFTSDKEGDEMSWYEVLEEIGLFYGVSFVP